ncbi:MAG: hypothetical protein ACKO2P_12290 [Planctomycetota bacterium]
MSKSYLSRFLQQDAGFVLSSEALLMGTTAILGLLVGLVSVRDSLVEEFEDFSEAIGFLNQSYSYTGVSGNGNDASTQGGLFEDSLEETDFQDILTDLPEEAPEDGP